MHSDSCYFLPAGGYPVIFVWQLKSAAYGVCKTHASNN
ncbi:hypothetical protein Y11_20951 [Yersinia enterocolitica subsp. palearctica Y11]|uniref:Uncharacterized protein n=2 Tax=Yersinia enterocolitica TaxID=630 RepID=A0A0H3NLS0_YERE1|nr:hypothetical protein YE150_10055 [Yersinia enterocolitica subsp. palearctica YE-150]EOR76834.1 hypothetical protein YEP1_10125 [Yersinia enterocolitica subsp. palearctica YE-P1]CBX72614.1 unknown protein [Yersinia enterocolitica W22703]CBY26086.1 hypothetical protein Y11_20951 [Yersinia enterocolitica subsp. palearctica Y11]CCO69698.1 hypothetical protein D322_2824 [Yersinia enterocolitica IP 10393]